MFVKEDKLNRSEMVLFKKKKCLELPDSFEGGAGELFLEKNEDWIALLRMLFKSKM